MRAMLKRHPFSQNQRLTSVLLRLSTNAYRVWFHFLPLLLCVSCTVPRVTVQSTGDLSAYGRVYLAPPPNGAQYMHALVLERLQKTGFKVTQLTPGDPPINPQGTGFVLTPDGKMLTCGHVVAGHTNASIWIDNVRYVARVVSFEPNFDAALLVIDGQHQPLHPLPLHTGDDYHLGETVYTIGFPLADIIGTAPRLNKGLVSSTVGFQDNPEQVQISAEVQPGNSGGPLLNERGEAIGMVVATLNPAAVIRASAGALPQNVNFATKIDPLREFLASEFITLPPAPEGSPGTSLDAAAHSIALVRGGVVEEKDIRTPGLWCRFGGIRSGDVIHHLDFFAIEFLDLRTGAAVFQASHRDSEVWSSETAVLDRIFEEICAKFFPDRPNPFKK